MKKTPPLFGRVLSLLVVWAIGFSAFIVLGGSMPVQAPTLCSQSNVTIGSDWTIPVGVNELCEGTMFTMTGNLNVLGTLELKDGGIQFKQTPSTSYAVTVTGKLLLTNALITVTGETVDPALKLRFNVNNPGELEMRDDAGLAFPGWLNVSGGSLDAMDSSISGIDPSDWSQWSTDPMDKYAPVMTFTDSTSYFSDSSMSNLYEATADQKRDIAILGSSKFYSINSYIGVDLDNATATTHNSMRIEGTSEAYLLWPTITPSSNPSHLWGPPIVSVGGVASAFVYRRVSVTVVDPNGVPVKDARITVTYSLTGTNAVFPDRSSGATAPSDYVLAYLGRAVATWMNTDDSGNVIIPLVSDRIRASGAEVWGNYNVTATYSPYSATKQVGLAHWPVTTDAANNVIVTLKLIDMPARPLPDLTPSNMIHTPEYLKANYTVANITIEIWNQGSGGAINVLCRVYDNVISPSGLIYYETINFILGDQRVNLTTFTFKPISSGTHLIVVVVDPFNTVIESDESDNTDSFALPVTPLGPDLQTLVGSMTGFVGNPAMLAATINNIGDSIATGVVVNFYVGSLSTLVGTNSSIPPIDANGQVLVQLAWVPPNTGSYLIFAWADPYNVIPEPPPYDEENNIGNNTLIVGEAPNPTAYSDEIGAFDPYPEWGTSVNLNALVRNIGQADASRFYVNFSVDGTFIEELQTSSPMPKGRAEIVTTSASWSIPDYSCGYHTLKVEIDSRNDITEGSYYEADNIVTRTLQVFNKGKITYSGTHTLKYLPVTQNIEITGSITIKDGSIIVTQPQEACGRAFIKITGSLTLINSTITASNNDNWPLIIYISGNGVFQASDNSKILLNTLQGDGILEAGGNTVVTIADTLIKSDVSIHGASATFNRVTFQGKKLHVNTQGLTRIWDPKFQGTTYLALRSDDFNILTPDIDLRNATLDTALTSQLVFGGFQFAQITEVHTTKMTRWWEGTITQRAKVARYWWLTIEAVDGSGAVLGSEANAKFMLRHLNTQTLAFDLAPIVGRGDDLFMVPSGSTTWPVQAPEGYILYKAPSEERFATIGAQWMNATYRANGTALIGNITYTEDMPVVGFVNMSTTLQLTFSNLTPDLSITSISYDGKNGNSYLQPLNQPLYVNATIRNAGQIGVPSVAVSFYFTDVDSQVPLNVMDLPNSSYAPFFIGRTVISIPLNSSAIASVYWDMPTGSLETTYTISVVVDPPIGDPLVDSTGLIKEMDEFNNILKRQISLFVWPDLHLEADQVQLRPATQGNDVQLTVVVKNIGTNSALGVKVGLSVNFGPIIANSTPLIDIAKNGQGSVDVYWRPTNVGQHNLTFIASVPGPTRNEDYNPLDNSVTLLHEVSSPPDLALNSSDYPTTYPTYNVTQGSTLYIDVTVYNIGQTDANMFAVGIFLSSTLLASTSGVNVSAGQDRTVRVNLIATGAINDYLIYDLTIKADANDFIAENNELNNVVAITVEVLAPIGDILIDPGFEGKRFDPGSTLVVEGRVMSTTGENIPGIVTRGFIKDSSGSEISSSTWGPASDYGRFVHSILIPDNIEGDYTLQVEANQTSIRSMSVSITIQYQVDWWNENVPLLNIPVWLFLLIIIVIIVVIVAVIAYTRFVGLGKMVECGECGAFIPEDSTKCPKCGVEFEKDMAKCSNCQAWIPLDVKQCPECGVEFATGEVEMADYEQKMRIQYNEVKAKFRAQAQGEIGRALSDAEFEAWWKRQPSFVTFEEWLREEEEMRKMGSKPCPVCDTLNSVTATVCHKCGTLLKKEEKKERPPPRAPPKKPEAEAAEAAYEPRPTEPVPKKVVVKKPMAPPVVQKKVVVKRPEDKKEEEGSSGE